MQPFTSKDIFISKNVITYTQKAFPSHSTQDKILQIPNKHAFASSAVFMLKSQVPTSTRPPGSNNCSTVEAITHLQ